MVDGLPREGIELIRRLIRPWSIVLLTCLGYLAVILALNDGDPLAFAVIGSRYELGVPGGTEGYDGQFAYYIAVDPADAADQLDVPAYRYQRILYPMLARGLALGNKELVPWTLVLINFVALVVGTAIMERLLERFGVSSSYALVYGLYAGQLMSVRLDLNEPLCFGLTCGAIWAFERERRGWSSVLFALAALSKETALVFAGAYALYLIVIGKWGSAVRLGLVAAAPLALWQVFLWRWLGSPGIGSGGAMATPFEIIPFMGLWRIGAVSMPVLALYTGILGPLIVAPTVWALWKSGKDLLTGRWHPVSLALLFNAVVLVFLPHSSWRELIAMLRLSIGLVLTVLLYAGLRRDRRVLIYAFGWMAALAFLFKEGSAV